MNIIPMLAADAESGLPWMKIILGCAVVLFFFFVTVIIWASRYTKSGPNQVLVISGRKRKMTEPDGPRARWDSAWSRAAAVSSGPSWKR